MNAAIPFMTRWRSALEHAHLDFDLLTPLEHSVAVAFARAANSDGSSILISHRSVARMLNVHVDTVGAAMRRLVRLGFFVKVRAAKGGRGRTDSSGEYRCQVPETHGAEVGPFAGTPDKHPINTRDTPGPQAVLPTGPTGPTEDQVPGKDAHSRNASEPLLQLAIAKMVAGEFDVFESASGSRNEPMIPSRFYGDDLDENAAAFRLLQAAADALHATGRVSNGMAYLCTPQALSLDDGPFLVRVLAAYRDPHGFTKVAA